MRPHTAPEWEPFPAPVRRSARRQTSATEGFPCRRPSGWHPDLRRLLAESDPAARGAQRFVASPLPAPRPSSRVTLLGDAVHVMPPTGGLGGNSALRDAHRLTLALSAVAHAA